MKRHKIEEKVGEVKLNKYNLFLNNIDDLSDLIYWKNRLRKLKESYAITYTQNKYQRYYHIFVNTGKAKSNFKT